MGLYSNIGKKIMVVSFIFAILTAISGFIGGIIFLSIGYDEFIFIGLCMMILSPLFAYLSSLLMFGFGKLVDSAEKLEKKICNNNVSSAPVYNANELPRL